MLFPRGHGYSGPQAKFEESRYADSFCVILLLRNRSANLVLTMQLAVSTEFLLQIGRFGESAENLAGLSLRSGP